MTPPVNWSWRTGCIFFYCLYPFSLGGSTLYAIWEWRHRYHFISNFGEETPFYWLFQRGGTIFWVNFGGGWWSFFLFMSKTVLEVGYSFILWSMLYLEGWSSRSSYFIGVALQYPFIYPLQLSVNYTAWWYLLLVQWHPALCVGLIKSSKTLSHHIRGVPFPQLLQVKFRSDPFHLQLLTQNLTKCLFKGRESVKLPLYISVTWWIGKTSHS